MSDRLNDESSEAQRRAEKIKAIRRSIHGEAEVAPTTYDNKTAESERSETMAERIMHVKEKHSSTAEDILDELDEAIAFEKAEAVRMAAEEAAEAEKAAVNASPDISDIINELETPAQEELSEIADEITEDFSEVDTDIAAEVEDFTETAAESSEEELTEVSDEAEAETETAETGSYAEAEDIEETMVFTPVGQNTTVEDQLAPLKRAEEEAAQQLGMTDRNIDGHSFQPMEKADETVKPEKKKKKKKKKPFKQRLRGLFPEKGDSVLECIRKIVFLGSVIAICVCGYLVGDYYYDLWSSKHKTAELMDLYDIYKEREPQIEEETTPEGDKRKKYGGMLDGAKKLWDINHDIVGVISIPDTPLNNPVLQADDNSKYLNMKYDLTENIAGEIFMDYRNHFDDVGEDGYLRYENSQNLIIYGHDMWDDQMFGFLKYYLRNEAYYGAHPVIDLSSNYERYKYKIFAFFMLDNNDDTDTKFDCWNVLDFADEKEFYDFVNEAKRRTIRTNDVDVEYGDQLLTLSTCSTFFPDERGRLIILARRVREGEDPMKGTQDSKANPNIKWPTLYYSIHPDEHYDPNAEFVPYGPKGGK
ncbi:class B sortase [Ruminococcus flavefaciens]|uniref:class B sortase n=1 Tax=Ruminococcus flavefaciens TaxID=1265 RepID=UPI0004B261C9|nr:class B sortase [Ruminococcus flavefaciens]